jgi:hypothetical protein
MDHDRYILCHGSSSNHYLFSINLAGEASLHPLFSILSISKHIISNYYRILAVYIHE